MLKNKKILLFFVSLCLSTIFCVSPNAIKTDLQVMPEAVKTEIQGIKNDMGQLKAIVDNKVDAKVMAETIDNFKQEFNEQLLDINKTINNSGTIKYGGAGWVVVGSSLMAIIFLSAIGLTIKYYLKSNKTSNMLGLVTTAVKNINPEIGDMVKAQITKEASNGGKFNIEHKNQLAEFVKNN